VYEWVRSARGCLHAVRAPEAAIAKAHREVEGLRHAFEGTEREAFTRATVRKRALDAWNVAGLEPLTPHEARHCAVSYFIAAGMNPKQIST
jgi:hypothetical protein